MEKREEERLLRRDAAKLYHASASQIEQYIKDNDIEHFDMIRVLRYVSKYVGCNAPAKVHRGKTHSAKCPMCGIEFLTTKPGNRHYCVNCRVKVNRMGSGAAYC